MFKLDILINIINLIMIKYYEFILFYNFYFKIL